MAIPEFVRLSEIGLAGGLGTYVRLESLGIMPKSAFDEGFQGGVLLAGPGPERG